MMVLGPSVRTACYAFLLVGCVRAIADEAASPGPNIIFFLADDLGYAEVGCYGQKKICTPNVDRLAAEGMRFTQHYSGNPVCAFFHAEGHSSSQFVAPIPTLRPP